MIALTPPVLLISVNANVQQEEWERDVTKVRRNCLLDLSFSVSIPTIYNNVSIPYYSPSLSSWLLWTEL